MKTQKDELSLNIKKQKFPAKTKKKRLSALFSSCLFYIMSILCV